MTFYLTTESIDYDQKQISDVAIPQKALFTPLGPATTVELAELLD